MDEQQKKQEFLERMRKRSITPIVKEAYIDATERNLANPTSEVMGAENSLVYNDFKDNPEALDELQTEVQTRLMNGTLNLPKRESTLDRKPAVVEEYDADKINERLAKIKAMLQKR